MKRKKAAKKTKTVRRKKVSKRRVTKRVGALPALSTLVKQPKRRLEAGVRRYETAIEIKEAPGMFSGGRRLMIGPKRRRGGRRPQKLPPEIAKIFE